MRYEDYQFLEFERRNETILTVFINRPDVLNATNAILHTELKEIWLTIKNDPTVKVVIVTGRGKAFSAGGDFDLLGEITENYDVAVRILKEAVHIVENMINLDRPIISAINGVAVGAGLAVALSSDISVVGENVNLIDGHLRFGVAAGDHACLIWPLYISMAKAKYYLLTGAKLNGKEAERIGLVSKCVPDNCVLDVAIEIADRLNNGHTLAIEFTKRALNLHLKKDWSILELSTALEMLNFLSDEVKAEVSKLRAR